MGSKEMKKKRKRLYRLQNGKCFICGKPMFQPKSEKDLQHPARATLEHIIAKADGGSSRIENLAVSHLYCNIKKASDVEREQVRNGKNGEKSRNDDETG
jgi:5-methylcytosine-specific restriction endonuclease McrA